MGGLLACARPEAPEPAAPEPFPSPEVIVAPPANRVPGDSAAPADEQRGPPEAFELSGTPGLWLGPEGYFANAVAMAPDGSFVLAASVLGPEQDKQMHLGVYTSEGRSIWTRTLTSPLRVEGPELALSERGEVSLWVKLHGGEAGTGPGAPPLSDALVRYSPEGTVLWTREVYAGYGPGTVQLDASGSVTVAEGENTSSDVPMTRIHRRSASGELELALPVRDVGIWGGFFVRPGDGAVLLAGSTPWLDWGLGKPVWSLLDREGTVRASGTVHEMTGSFQPLFLSEEGRYLALLHVSTGTGRFAGQPVECIRISESGCAPFLVSGHVDGREDSAVVFPRDERIVWVSPTRELVTLQHTQTELILRRRSSTAQLLATSTLPWGLSPRDGAPRVSLSKTVARPDGSVWLLGTLQGAADLGGTRVEARWSRPFLLRVEL